MHEIIIMYLLQRGAMAENVGEVDKAHYEVFQCTFSESKTLAAGVQPRLIQGIRRRDGVGEGQETTA